MPISQANTVFSSLQKTVSSSLARLRLISVNEKRQWGQNNLSLDITTHLKNLQTFQLKPEYLL